MSRRGAGGGHFISFQMSTARLLQGRERETGQRKLRRARLGSDRYRRCEYRWRGDECARIGKSIEICGRRRAGSGRPNAFLGEAAEASGARSGDVELSTPRARVPNVFHGGVPSMHDVGRRGCWLRLDALGASPRGNELQGSRWACAHQSPALEPIMSPSGPSIRHPPMAARGRTRFRRRAPPRLHPLRHWLPGSHPGVLQLPRPRSALVMELGLEPATPATPKSANDVHVTRPEPVFG